MSHKHEKVDSVVDKEGSDKALGIGSLTTLQVAQENEHRVSKEQLCIYMVRPLGTVCLTRQTSQTVFPLRFRPGE